MKEQKIGRIKDCYRFTDSHKDPFGYYLIASQGYYLQEISTIPGLNATKQIANVEPNSPLAKYYCMRTCKAGEYYDFESTYCRKCDIGCSSCTSFETCDICLPGWNLIENPKYLTHKIEYRSQEETQRAEGKRELKPGMCLQGCQLGFFAVPFKGHCKECNKNCLKCNQKMVKHRYGGEETNNKTMAELFEGYCVQCRPRNEKMVRIYTEIPTGRCLESCTARGQFATSINYEIEQINTAKKKINICVTCQSLRCKKCEIKNTAKCLECYEEFYGLEKGKCVKFRESQLYKSLIIGGIFMGAFFGLLLLFIIITSLMSVDTEGKKKLEEEAKEKIKNQTKKMDGALDILIRKATMGGSRPSSPTKKPKKSGEKVSLIGESNHQRRLGTSFDVIAEQEEEDDKT